ncbi:hypothetical protein Poly30_46710 [Planctomycetes bacterium Poly30]|uniref:DUF3472 domain-containing protein n=1 Tax=Saltatorellus ferox TaxID=2528018 RepID=A0A518EYJ3_9BACT|nr:hypothetical protein Poly30_46710 [Planctomycetes bacterium Poly30]
MLLLSLVLALPLHAVSSGGGAAPSSHLVYSDASFEGDILINEVRVPASGEAVYTYYEALGWGGRAAGYAGIQAHPNGHNFLFSIWDHDDHTAPIEAVHRGAGTLTENFGGEGTGLKSWNFELGWDTDVWYALVARSWAMGDHTFYGYWVRSDKTREWTHLVTMDVAAKDAHLLGGNDSFLEDWLETGTALRTTNLRRGWKRRLNGEWHAFGAARYSVNSWDLTEGKRSYDFRRSWDGGVRKDRSGEYYYMTSGGADTRPTTENPSTFEIARSEERPGFAPIVVRSARAVPQPDGRIIVSWKVDPKSSPLFAYTLIGKIGEGPTTRVLLEQQTIEPHARLGVALLPDGVDPAEVTWTIQCRDIFDQLSQVVTAE